MDYIKKHILAIVAIVISIMAWSLAGQSQGNFGAINRITTTVTNPFTFQQGLTNSSTLTQTGAATFASTIATNGIVTANAGVIKSYTNATSTTATTQTLVQADILNYDTLLLTPNIGALTLTLPATSTLTSMVPSAGDTQDLCIYNATSTASTGITLVAGAGMDLERVATSTTAGSTGVLVIPTQGYACLKFVRETDTDVGVLMTSYIDAD